MTGTEKRDPIDASTIDGRLSDVCGWFIESGGEKARRACAEYFLVSAKSETQWKAQSPPVKYLDHWLRNKSIPVSTVNSHHIQEFIDSCPGAYSTKARYLSVLRGLFDELTRAHIFLVNPINRVRTGWGPTKDDSPPISSEEYNQLVESIGCTSEVDFRDLALIRLLWLTGARSGELSRLAIGDYSQTDVSASITLTSSNNIKRKIQLDDETEQSVRDYFSVAHLHVCNPEAPLFRVAAEKRTPVLTSKRAPTHYISRVLRRRLDSANLSEHITSDSFRLAVVQRLANRGASVQEIQKFLGFSATSSVHNIVRRSKLAHRLSRTG